MEVSYTAGSNGVRYHDSETGEEFFTPASEYGSEPQSPAPASPDLQVESSEITPQHIINGDGRVEVLSPSGRFESTCLLGSRFGKRVDIGTGWLVNQNYVMTAGHLLYTFEDGYSDHVGVYIGSSRGSYKYYRLGHCYHIGQGYYDNCNLGYYGTGMYDDWGVIKLDSPVTGVGHLGRFTVNSAADMQGGRTYYTQGYPKDLNYPVYGSQWNKWTMYTTSGTIKGDRTPGSSLVETEIDIMKGQSGSPLYSYRAGVGYAAEGIVVAESDSEKDGIDIDRNFILLINNKLASWINNNLF